MGYYTQGGVKCFEPDNTDDTLYFRPGISLAEIMDVVSSRWPDVCESEILIKAEHIQTHCIGYDLYDAGDYTDFIVVEKDL